MGMAMSNRMPVTRKINLIIRNVRCMDWIICHSLLLNTGCYSPRKKYLPPCVHYNVILSGARRHEESRREVAETLRFAQGDMETCMSIRGASKQIIDTLLTWEGIETHPHRFGGTEFRMGKREIGHIHGDSLVDIPFPKKVRNEIVVAGEASPHHILPETGWVSFYLREDGDVEKAIMLLNRSYKIALKRKNMA